MSKRWFIVLIIFILISGLSAACDAGIKMVKRDPGGTSTLTPFAPKATFTSTYTPSAVELTTNLIYTATIVLEKTSEVEITQEPSLTATYTLTPESSTPTISDPEFSSSPSATINSVQPTVALRPSATTKPIDPSSTVPPAGPTATQDQPADTNTPQLPTSTYTAEPPTATAEPPATQTPSGCNIAGNSSYENQVVTLINQERTSRGLSALSNNSSLRLAARRHSEDMACNDFFSHTGSDGSTLSSRILAAGYSYSWAAENIAASSSCSFSASSVVNMWMNSSGHKANILSANAVHIGVGFRCVSDGISGDLDAYYTADFGRP